MFDELKDVDHFICDELYKKYNELINSEELDEILNDGIEKSRKLAKEKYEIVRKKIGLGR